MSLELVSSLVNEKENGQQCEVFYTRWIAQSDSRTQQLTVSLHYILSHLKKVVHLDFLGSMYMIEIQTPASFCFCFTLYSANFWRYFKLFYFQWQPNKTILKELVSEYSTSYLFAKMVNPFSYLNLNNDRERPD